MIRYWIYYQILIFFTQPITLIIISDVTDVTRKVQKANIGQYIDQALLFRIKFTVSPLPPSLNVLAQQTVAGTNAFIINESAFTCFTKV